MRGVSKSAFLAQTIIKYSQFSTWGTNGREFLLKLEKIAIILMDFCCLEMWHFFEWVAKLLWTKFKINLNSFSSVVIIKNILQSLQQSHSKTQISNKSNSPIWDERISNLNGVWYTSPKMSIKKKIIQKEVWDVQNENLLN